MIDLPAVAPDGSIWVFGYGSLMWNPGFDTEEVRHAKLAGYQRRFCIYSVHHRGSAARPGLVLGLDRGGTCDGLAFRVSHRNRRDVLAYLRAREQINGVYRETNVNLSLADGAAQRIDAITFVAERHHPSYAGVLALERQAHLIRAAAGQSGPNIAYLFSTLERLEALGLKDANLKRLASLIGPHFAAHSPRSGLHIGARAGGVRMACQRFPVTVPRMPPGERRRFTYRLQIAAWQNLDEGRPDATDVGIPRTAGPPVSSA